MDFEVNRNDLQQVRAHHGAVGELGAGRARVHIDAFALSSNNISYAVFGDVFGYWNFFPAAPDEPSTDVAWGRIPVWGFGNVIETTSPDVVVGDRLFGYYPMSSEVTLSPGEADPRHVFDVAPHRAAMAGAYSQYLRTAADPVYRPDREPQHMLLYPLFFTSFLADDLLADNGGFGATSIVLSSASSKTAIAMAFLAHRRDTHVIGLTSAANIDFVSGLDVYDQVLDYDTVDQIEADKSVYVDIAGNRDVTDAVHRRLTGTLTYSMRVGGTHWNHHSKALGAPPGPNPELFFAPTQIAKRNVDWGADVLEARLHDAWDPFVSWADSWIDLRHASGMTAVTDVYRELLAGRPDPRIGHICTLSDD